jgi:hypothetical protein
MAVMPAAIMPKVAKIMSRFMVFEFICFDLGTSNI